MMNKPFFSVIIPTLNEERYLPKLLADLTNQSYKDFEVIIVDGNSEDKTCKVAEKFSTGIPRLYILDIKKRNLSYQRNTGAKKAKGKFFVFFDADVGIPPEFFEGIHYAILSKKMKFLTTWLQPDTHHSSDILLMKISNICMEITKILEKPYAGGFNTIVHRDVFQKVNGFKENLTMSEDHDFATRAYKAGYDLTILKDPKLTMSFRRFRSEGTLRVLQKYALANIYYFLHGPMKKHYFNYSMGGHVHDGKKREKQQGKYIFQMRDIRRFQHKIRDFLET